MNILFVDDENMILNSLKRGLRNVKHDFYFANSGNKALELMEINQIDIIFSDMRMPGMSGLDLLKIVEEKYPMVVKVILSGYAQLPQLIATINQSSIFKYIAKPWDLHKELIPTIEECVNYVEFKNNEKLKFEQTQSLNTVYKNIFKSYNTKTSSKDQSYDVIRIFQQLYTKVLLIMVEDQITPATQKIAAIKNFKLFMDLLLDEMKEQRIYFESKRTVSDTIKKLQNHTIKFEADYSKYENRSLIGRGQHIQPLIISLLSALINESEYGVVSVLAEEEIVDHTSCIVKYSFVGSKHVFSKYKSSKFSLILFRSIAKIFGGDLVINVDEVKVEVVLKGLLHIDRGGDEGDENTDS